MKRLLMVALLLTFSAFAVTLYPVGENRQVPKSVPLKAKSTPAAILTNSCIDCHKGIEPIRDHQSKMMRAIFKKADKAGAKDNDCVVCHGGSPTEERKEKAHSGTLPYFKNHKGPKAFYPFPGSPWINENTCGMCHPKQVAAQENNLMATEQGKIHGALWGFGGKDGYNHNYTNFGGKSPDPHKRLGTELTKNIWMNSPNSNHRVSPK